MRKASPIGVLSVSETGPGLLLGFFPIRPVDDDLRVLAGGKEVFRERLALKTEETYKREVRLDRPEDGYEVRIGTHLAYSSRPESREIDRPLHFQAVDEGTAEGLYLAGLRSEQERMLGPALGKYLACISRDPLHVRALARAAELYGRRGEYLKGLELAGRALDISMYDAGANYVYGVMARRLGRLTDARETLGWAARSTEYRSPAYVQLAELAAAGGD